jgi:hypothetical protein
MENTQEAIVTLDSETNKNLRHLAVLKGADELTLLNQLVARAVKDACYRHRRNAQVWEQKKALAERQADLIQKAKAAGIDVSMFE